MAAPAPSPQRIHEALSFQLTVRVMISDATTSIFLQYPVARYCEATLNPKINPEQAAAISKVTAWGASNFAWSQFAPAGQQVSGVMVANIIRSRSVAVMPAISRALCEASRARSDVFTFGSAILLSFMPVR
jgi:hypothetical protein